MHKTNAGFTLIEILVAVVIFSMLTSLVTVFFSQNVRTFAVGRVSNEVISGLRDAVVSISTSVREARNGSIVITSNQISFQVWGEQSGVWENVVFRLSGGVITKNGRVITENVASLLFTPSNGGRVMDITASTVSSLRGVTEGLPYTFNIRVLLRN